MCWCFFIFPYVCEYLYFKCTLICVISGSVSVCAHIHANVSWHANIGFWVQCVQLCYAAMFEYTHLHVQMLPLKNGFICFEAVCLPVCSLFEFLCVFVSAHTETWEQSANYVYWVSLLLALPKCSNLARAHKQMIYRGERESGARWAGSTARTMGRKYLQYLYIGGKTSTQFMPSFLLLMLCLYFYKLCLVNWRYFY